MMHSHTELEQLQARARMLELVEQEVRKDVNEVHRRIQGIGRSKLPE